MKRITLNLLRGTLVVLVAALSSCSSNSEKSATVGDKQVGVLLVNHGSRSETWRNALLDLEKAVRDSLLKNEKIGEVKTAFMEYTEPSIATRLKEFDEAGFTDVVIVPVFLTVSSHSFDDIPTIIGQKEDPQSLEALKIEKIARYTPKARVTITPLLDYPDILQKNILKRASELSKNPEKEGLVLIGYGDATYNTDWSNLFVKVGEYVNQHTGISGLSYGWCGHLVHYNPDSTTAAIEQVLKEKERAIVVPVLVAHDEMFQVQIIGDGIAKIKNNKERVSYRPDAILPDPNVENWVITATNTAVEKLNNNTLAGK